MTPKIKPKPKSKSKSKSLKRKRPLKRVGSPSSNKNKASTFKEVVLDEDASAVDTFLFLSDLGLTNKDRVVVQFFPEFLQEVAMEIRARLTLQKVFR